MDSLDAVKVDLVRSISSHVFPQLVSCLKEYKDCVVTVEDLIKWSGLPPTTDSVESTATRRSKTAGNPDTACQYKGGRNPCTSKAMKGKTVCSKHNRMLTKTGQVDVPPTPAEPSSRLKRIAGTELIIDIEHNIVMKVKPEGTRVVIGESDDGGEVISTTMSKKISDYMMANNIEFESSKSK